MQLLRFRYGEGAGFAGIDINNSYNNRLQPAVLSAAAGGSTIYSFSYSYNQGSPS